MEKAWKPSWEVKMEAKDERNKMEDVLEKFQGILNRLTLQNFQKLIPQVLELDIDTEDRLKGVVDIIFEKV